MTEAPGESRGPRRFQTQPAPEQHCRSGSPPPAWPNGKCVTSRVDGCRACVLRDSALGATDGGHAVGIPLDQRLFLRITQFGARWMIVYWKGGISPWTAPWNSSRDGPPAYSEKFSFSRPAVHVGLREPGERRDAGSPPPVDLIAVAVVARGRGRGPRPGGRSRRSRSSRWVGMAGAAVGDGLYHREDDHEDPDDP